ncbi:pectinesterase/pectinesterase inhibitor PPE8B-like [Capsicum annuum]|uniref:pectinesterase/pectinesterase inhibitor PPE8B-like n=1 Tax=Capsicum annuum TaxID=4072 RepID=UPI001FB0970E|nr:pectinesterase/pectinesterase inhibitor PPE8B-like [Capsicum annuum]
MNFMKALIVIFAISRSLVTFSSENLIDVCQTSSNFKLCTDSLRADPKSFSADKKVVNRLAQTKEPVLKECLHICEENYGRASSLAAIRADESQLTETSNAVISHDRFGDRATKFIEPTQSGDFWTIAEAIQAEPDRSIERYYIKIKQGTYREYIQVAKKKTNIVLIGEGMKTTIIGGNRSFADGNKTFDTGTVGISGNGFTAQDITFRNDAGPRKFQAVALRVESDMVSFYRCRFEGYQDTLYTRRDRHQFYRDCEIYGTVDFICGNARALFQNCLIQAHIPLDKQYNTITAQERDLKDGQTGLVLQNCTIKASRDLEKMDDITTYLGRP